MKQSPKSPKEKKAKAVKLVLDPAAPVNLAVYRTREETVQEQIAARLLGFRSARHLERAALAMAVALMQAEQSKEVTPLAV